MLFRKALGASWAYKRTWARKRSPSAVVGRRRFALLGPSWDPLGADLGRFWWLLPPLGGRRGGHFWSFLVGMELEPQKAYFLKNC